MNKKITGSIKAILFCIVFMGVLMLASSLKYMLPLQYERYSYGIIGMAAAFLVTWLFLKFDKKRFANIGLQWEPATIKRFFTGFAIGLLISAAMMFSLFIFIGLKIELAKDYNIGLFFAWAMALLLLSYMEEVAFRAYPFITLKNAAGVWPAQIIIAILFALYHVAGGQSVASSFMGPGIWAFIFGWAALKSGGIAMPTGIHFAANLFQAAIGQKKDFNAIWQIQYAGELTPALQEKTAVAGNIVHLILLVAGVVLTQNVIKKKYQH